jgi:FkbM family methyltransferase
MLRKISKFLRAQNKKHIKTYAQCGEDVIIDFAFKTMGMEHPTYLDIGAHHPTYLSNTYYFYKQGSKGICIEADPMLSRKIAKKRPKDMCLNIGIGSKIETAEFYIMSTPTLNTFSSEEAERLENTTSQKIKKIVKIPLRTVHDIIEKQGEGKCPNLISLDVEGLDKTILQSIDFKKYRPEIVCVETLTFTEDNNEKKISEIINLMIENDYFLYADTYINSIFVCNKAWAKR